MKTKVCPVILRRAAYGPQVLAFRHPRAGHQIVKGTLEPSEAPGQAALRELFEESGIRLHRPMRPLGPVCIRRGKPADPPRWLLYAATVCGLPERWQHYCTDDGGLVFSFFWHPLALPLRPTHSAFNDAILGVRRALAHGLPPVSRASFSPARPAAPE